MSALLGLPAAFDTRTGRVTEFDDQVGSGRVKADNGRDSWFFHCTRIADGSRTIPVGVAVTFEVVPGPTGLEAVAIRRRV